MKLIKPSVEIWEQEPGIEGMYRQIERVARISYKSEAKMTEDSSKPFVDKLIARGHLSCLEHGTVYLDITDPEAMVKGFEKYSYNPYSKVYKNTLEESQEAPHLYVTSNLRVLWENQWMDDLEWFCNPTEYHSERHCVHFISDIGTMREFFRHRKFSMMQESSRFCGYSSDKFGNEITFIIPCWMDIPEVSYDPCIFTSEDYWKEWEELPESIQRDDYLLAFFHSIATAELDYMKLIEEGWQPQQARAVLPMCTKSEAVMTGFYDDWVHLFDLRCSFIASTGKPHPQASELADKLYSLI